MRNAGQFFLILSLVCWGSIVGGVLYSHIAYFSSYLSHLPESGVLVNGPYPVRDGMFWMTIHPIAIICTILALVFNRRLKTRRKYIMYAAIIYALAIIATSLYFVPELIAFAKSDQNTTVTAAEWHARGQKWQYLSWTRGAFMYLGFIFLLIALTKTDQR